MAAGDDRRLLQLLESAAQAFERGQTQDAEQLLRQAHAEAPQHPLVLNEIARLMLAAGNPAGAYELLEQAVEAASSHPSVWINMAAALRALNRVDEEMAALDKALAIEPRNLRALLQKASLHELQGRSRTAAATYRTALQLIPPGAEPPPAMRPVLLHAKECVDANNRALETFLEDHPPRLWLPGGRRAARMGSRESLGVRRLDRARGLERQRCAARRADL